MREREREREREGERESGRGRERVSEWVRERMCVLCVCERDTEIKGDKERP